jgi:hypothetical protein
MSQLTSQHAHRNSSNLGVVEARHGLPASTGASATPAGSRQDGATPQPQAQAANVVKVRKPRKKRDADAPVEAKKERAPRRPRGASTAATGSRKKPKLEAADENSTILVPRPQDSSLHSSTLVQPVTFSSQGAGETHKHEAAKYSDSGLSMRDAPMHSHGSPNRTYDYTVNAPAPPATTQRMMYDPIRSMDINRLIDPTPPPVTKLPPAQTPPRPTYNPSTSPAISGIIDHPIRSGPPTSTTPVSQSRPGSSYNFSHDPTNATLVPNGQASVGQFEGMVVDSPAPKKAATAKKGTSEAPTRATSPKPPRAKEQPPPPPIGSGLLSASLFGGDSSADMAQKDSKGPNIVLHINLKDPNNRVINFARMAEEKYGFAALYPRQAAQKERLAKVAAAGAALERSASGSRLGGTSAGESGDEDLSVDIERDSDNDGDVPMSGVNGGHDATNSGTDAAGAKRKRRRKMEEYNQDDPFIDDSEMLWEAHAAVVKDGFFVYCGPLVPEGEKPAVERYVNWVFWLHNLGTH